MMKIDFPQNFYEKLNILPFNKILGLEIAQ